MLCVRNSISSVSNFPDNERSDFAFVLICGIVLSSVTRLICLKIWVDADACPGAITDLINRAAHRLSIETVFVANRSLNNLPVSPFIKSVLVGAGADVADDFISQNATSGDLVVTHDVPLAAKLVPEGITVISPRGDLFHEDNISERLASRDLMHSLREFGTISGGPEPFNDKHKKAFANHFDAALHRLLRIK